MAQFRATIQGQRGDASRLGSKSSGITTRTNGWNVGVEVRGYYDEKTGEDVFSVYLSSGSNGYGGGKEIGRFTEADLKKPL